MNLQPATTLTNAKLTIIDHHPLPLLDIYEELVLGERIRKRSVKKKGQ
jgi:hypothetical protein